LNKNKQQNAAALAPEVEQKAGGYEEEITRASAPPRARNLLIYLPK